VKRTALKPGKGLSTGNKPLSSSNALKSHKKINNTSNKKRVRDGYKKDAYKRIDSEREQRCEGCGSATRPLSHSHLISVASGVRFESNIDNIRLHCLSFDGVKGCHEKWEDSILGEIDKMLDFEENMEIVKELSTSHYLIKHSRIYGIKSR